MRKNGIHFWILTLMVVVTTSMINATPVNAADYEIVGVTNNYITTDIANSAAWGKEANGVRVYMAEHGSYNTTQTYYNANFLVYKDKVLKAVFTECSTLPDAPKSFCKDINNYCAIVKEGEYNICYAGANRNNYQGPWYSVKTTSNSCVLPCFRWDGICSFVSKTCDGIEIHAGAAKGGTACWSTGCLNIKTTVSSGCNLAKAYDNMTKFKDCVGTGSAKIKIVRSVAANVTLASCITPASVPTNGTVTCILTTDQAATGVTATLNGAAAIAMTAADSTKTIWICTFTNFTSTGVRTVTFSATGTNGAAVCGAAKTFTVTPCVPNIVLTSCITPTSVPTTGTVTCTLTTDQAATCVTATLNGCSAITMTAADTTKKKWTCTFTNFTSTGTRTVSFSATGTNGVAVCGAAKTFTVTAPVCNVVLSPCISPTSVKKTGTVTCTLITDQAATCVTATLNGCAAKSMTAADTTKKKWTCTFTSFTTIGTRSVAFSAIGTNGNAVCVSKTFTVTN